MRYGDKASRLIASLDAARTQGSWAEVPELAKRLKRQTPQLKVLADVATAEAYVATYESGQSTPAPSDHAPLVALRDSLQTDSTDNEEDVFQGKTCLLWADWLGITSDTEKGPGDGFAKDMQALMNKETSTWTKICMVKGAYIRGIRSQQNRQILEAKSLFTMAVDLIQSNRDLMSSTPQLAYWSEQLLAQLALISPEDDNVTPQATNAVRLQVFRHWVYVVSWAKESPASTYRNSSAHLTRIVIWQRYYQHLCLLLRETSQNREGTNFEERLQLAIEFRKVENLYENEILHIHKFPKASETNTSIEEFVEQVIANWQILCGPRWQEAELGEGGRNAISRNVLDILYRAATKTFHSTLILRRLFQVHKSLTEFDLAYRSLDTYIELVERAKARASKSTTPVIGVESTETFLLTIAEGIEGLCSFGGHAEAHRAHNLCKKANEWLRKAGVHAPPTVQVNGDVHNVHNDSSSVTTMSPQSTEIVHRALGVGTAHWSRWTPYSEQRTQLQEDAVDFLNTACSQRSANEVQIETLYATALVLAESREITEAISHVKSALKIVALSASDGVFWSAERRAVPLWHLLALLLSSRQDFESASKSCNAAFEQFPSSTIFTGMANASSSVIAEKSHHDSSTGFVNDMECDEMQRIIEVRITELALTELKDGPEDAVNASNELLSVFSHLFAHLNLDALNSRLSTAKTPAATLKSVKGSIFSRRKNRISAAPSIEAARAPASVLSEKTRPSTQATDAPTIQVTDEHGRSPQHKRHRIRDSLERRHHGKKTNDSPKKLVRRASQKSHQNASQAELVTNLPVANDRDTAHETKQLLPEMKHNLGSHEVLPPPASHEDQPPQQDVRLPTVHPFTSATSPPTPRFSKMAAQRHALSILVKIWLVIATLYRRASMFEDSREACEEAATAASKIENIVGSMDHSAKAFAQAGWGGTGKSVDEIWADVYFERAELLLSIHQRRQLDGHQASDDDLRTAVEQYEQCLMFTPDHPGGNVGLSNLLLDYYERKIDLSRQVDDGKPNDVAREQSNANPAAPATVATTNGVPTTVPSDTQSLDGIPGSFEIPGPLVNGYPHSTQASARPSISAVDDRRTLSDNNLKKTPENLIRIAARDRAYGLLSALTKSGSGWDNSEAWYALARAHELSGEIEKAKSVLWWCVELEDTKPIRHWRNLGYILN